MYFPGVVVGVISCATDSRFTDKIANLDKYCH